MSFYGLLALTMLFTAALLSAALLREISEAQIILNAYHESSSFMLILAAAGSADSVPQQYLTFVYYKENILVIQQNGSVLAEDVGSGMAIER